MSRISVNLDSIIEKAEATVASHKIGKGDYARWLWQNAKKTELKVCFAFTVLVTTAVGLQERISKEL